MKKVFFIFVSFFLLSACPSKKEPADSGHQVEWFQGSMDQALAEAKKTQKPLFVYWGAVWCPPCNLLKSTVFTDRVFIESTKRYIRVYLDGDTESAQLWGDKLKATGYPTLMILNSNGEEVVRLSTTMVPQELADMMDAAFSNLKPINELVASVIQKKQSREGGDIVTKEEWSYLANYAWTQDVYFATRKEKLSEILESLESRIPVKLSKEKSRFYLNFLLAKAKEVGEDKKLPRDIREKGTKRLSAILEDEELVKYNLEVLAYYSVELIKAIYPNMSPLRDAVIERYRGTLANLRAKLSMGYDRTITYYPIVELGELFSDKTLRDLSESQKEEIKEEMVKAAKNAKSEQAKIYTSNTTTYILSKAGFSDLAKNILIEDLKNGLNDYYTMSSLAWIEKEAGNKEKALQWSEKAYSAAKGSATKIQWGSKYLTSLIDILPKQKDRIFEELENYYSHHLSAPDSFLGRNKSSLDRLSKQVKAWVQAEKFQPEIDQLKKKMIDSCSQNKEKKTKYYIKDCENYFKKLI